MDSDNGRPRNSQFEQEVRSAPRIEGVLLLRMQAAAWKLRAAGLALDLARSQAQQAQQEFNLLLTEANQVLSIHLGIIHDWNIETGEVNVIRPVGAQ